MSNRRYNPNSKYGKRKMREEFWRNYELKSQKEKDELNRDVNIAKFILFVIILIVSFIIIVSGGKIRL